MVTYTAYICILHTCADIFHIYTLPITKNRQALKNTLQNPDIRSVKNKLNEEGKERFFRGIVVLLSFFFTISSTEIAY